MVDMQPTLSVREPLSIEQDAVEDLLADAFLENPLILMLFGKNVSRRRVKMMNRWTLRNAHVKTLVALSGSTLVGACKYVDHPHCNPTGREWLSFLWDCVSAWGMRSLQNILTLLSSDKHPREEHRYLAIIGVSSSARRRGVASLLLETFIRSADIDQLPTVLETDTDSARALYEKFGFITQHKSTYKWGNVWHMTRDIAKT